MKHTKVFLILAVGYFLLASVLSSCASNAGASAVTVQIQAGTAEDPFKGTSWASKGITLLEFGTDGKVAYGYTTVSYKVKNAGAEYVASFRAGGVGLAFTIPSTDASEGVCVSGRVKMPCKKVE